MIGFHMSLGYQSGYLSQLTQGEQWELLKEAVKCVNTANVPLFTDTVKAYGFLDSVLDEKHADIYQWSEAYLWNRGLSILEEKREIMILAGAGGDYRVSKEAIALAVCHITMATCAKHGFHVNLKIA